MTRKNLILIGLLLSIVSIVSYWGIIKPSTLSTESSEQVVSRNNSLKIAVVNEDAGMVYNGQQLNIGELLTTSFASKGGYSVEVVSRSIAERGLENSVYQLMVVLPTKFSQDSLALESSSPAQAEFQYQIKSDKNHLVKQAEQAVVDLKRLFNQDLIHIYFLSIVGNLQTAQGQVGNVVSADGRVLNAFDTNLISPLTMYSRQFTGVSSSPTELLSAYTSFQKSLLESNDAFTSIVDVNKVYTAELEQIKSLQEEWQESILKREESLKTYDDEFSKLSVEEQLSQLSVLNERMSSENSNPEILADTQAKANQMKQDVESFTAKLRELNGTIDTALSDYDAKIQAAVKESLKESPSFDMEAQADTLGNYLKSIESLLTESFKMEFNRFSGYSDQAIEAMNLSEEDKRYLKALNAFALSYAQTHGLTSPQLESISNQETYFNNAKNIVRQEVAQPQQLTLPSIKGEVSEILMRVPEGYALNVSGISATHLGGGEYSLAIGSPLKESIDIRYSLIPNDDTAINLFSPLVVELMVSTKENFEYDRVVNPPVTLPPATDGRLDTFVPVENSSTDSGTETPDSSDVTSGWVQEETISRENIDRVNKVFHRTYHASSVFYPYGEYARTNHLERAVVADLRSYYELAGLIKAFYGEQFRDGSGTLEPSPSSLFGRIKQKYDNKEELQTIVVKLIQDTTVTELKNTLKTPEETIVEFDALIPKSEELSTYIDELRANTTKLLEGLATIVEQTQSVNETIKKKPTFVEQEKRDNTDLVTVSMSINSDLERLKNASQTLMDNTKAHQLVSESIQGQVDRLATDVKALETEGANLSGRVDELYGVMTKEYGDNAEFLKSFSTVLSNTKIGNSQNNAVYEYLSNPVDSSKIESLVGTVTKQADTRQDERSGFLLILMSYLVGLAASYILQHSDRSKWPKLVDVVARRHWTNSLYPFIFLTGVAFLAAVIIGGFAGYRLTLSGSQMFLLMMLLAVLTQFFAHGISHLNQYLKSYGFLISLFLVMMYLISAGQLLDSHYISHSSWVSFLSPLTYLEGMLTAFLNNKEGWTVTFILTLLLAGAVSGLTIYHYQELDESGV